MNKALFIFLFFQALICWGAELQDSRPFRKNNTPVSSARMQVNNQLSNSIRVSFFIIPPHIFLNENKKVDGAVYDLIKNHIAPEINVKFQWDARPTSFARQLHNLKEEKNYIACFLVYAQNRSEYLTFSKTPYYYARPIIAVHKSNPLQKITTVSDISHMVIGYSQNLYLSPFMRDPSIQFDFVKSPDFLKINLQKVINHRIDGIYSPGKASSLFYLKKFDMSDEFRLINLLDFHPFLNYKPMID